VPIEGNTNFMKMITLTIVLLAIFRPGQCQDFSGAHHWKVYYINGSNIFAYSKDTLKNFPYQPLNDDSMHIFLAEITEIPGNDAPVWMGQPNVASFETAGVISKIDISQYGGFFYDEGLRKYFQISKEKVPYWLDYIRNAILSIVKRSSTGG
jgi:hypothetical protein